MEIFSTSPIKTAKLKEVQASNVESPDKPRRKWLKLVVLVGYRIVKLYLY